MLAFKTLSLIYFVIRRELHIGMRQAQTLLNPLLFYIIITSLFPLAISSDMHFLKQIAPGVIWVSALLATLLALDKLFFIDFEEGILEQWVLSHQPLVCFVIGKVIGHWLLTGLPLILITFPIAIMLGIPTHVALIFILTLLLGTPTLSLIGAIGAALTLGLRNSGILLSLLILPFYIPILVFGVSSIAIIMENLSAAAPFAILGAFLILALTLAPITIAALLRIMVLSD